MVNDEHGHRAGVVLQYRWPSLLARLCKLRNVVLVLLVAQTTSVVLLMRFSKTRSVTGPSYSASVAVLMAELMKLPICFFMAYRCVGSVAVLQQLLRDELVVRFKETLKCSVPALAYTVQGNLLFFALASLEAPTYQVTYQTKTIFTAIFSWMLLGKQITPAQWVAVVLLSLGTVLVSDLGSRPTAPQNQEIVSHNALSASAKPFRGIIAVLVASILSSSSSVYFEKMLKKTPNSSAAAAASLWLRNIQLGIFATPLALLTVLLSDWKEVAAEGWLAGFDAVVWIVVVLNGLGGLLVAATMKYADNIVKCFAAALAILSGSVFSVALFGFKLSTVFLLGSACTIVASILYAWAPELPICSRRAISSRECVEKSKHGEKGLDLTSLEGEETQLSKRSHLV